MNAAPKNKQYNLFHGTMEELEYRLNGMVFGIAQSTGRDVEKTFFVYTTDNKDVYVWGTTELPDPVVKALHLKSYFTYTRYAYPRTKKGNGNGKEKHQENQRNGLV